MNGFVKVACAGAVIAFATTATLTGAIAAEGEMMRDVLGSLGILEKQRDPIVYRERAPLVIPPKTDLRPPVEPGALANSSPQWPNDPDVAARKRKAADDRVPVTYSEARRMSDANPRLTNQELRAGTRPGASIPDAPVVRYGDNSREGHWVNPDVLRNQSRVQEEASVSPSGEPDRKSLLQPPTGYRRSANGDKVQGDYAPVIRESDAQQASPFAFINRNLFGRDD